MAWDDITGEWTPDPVVDSSGALAGSSSGLTGSSGSGFFDFMKSAIGSATKLVSSTKTAGSTSTASPLTSAVSGLVGTYNTVASFFGKKTVKNNLANANTTANPNAAIGSNTLIYVGIGVVVLGVILWKVLKK